MHPALTFINIINLQSRPASNRHTFNEYLEFILLYFTILEFDFQSQQQGEQEFVIFVQTSSCVPKRRPVRVGSNMKTLITTMQHLCYHHINHITPY